MAIELIELAQKRGIISSEQLDEIMRLATENGREDTSQGERIDFSVSARDEPFRLFKGFRDFFIAIGILILATGLSMVMSSAFDILFGSRARALNSIDGGVGNILGLLINTAIAVGIAEWVTRSQRLPLSSLVLTIVLAMWAGMLGGLAFVKLAIGLGMDSSLAFDVMPFVGFTTSIIALLLYYWRHRLPFVLLPLAGVVVLSVLLTLNAIFDFDHNSLVGRISVGICGVIVFIAAMRFDFKDRFRQTRYSECAFWLHLLAAPLIVHSILLDTTDGAINSPTILAVVGVLAVIALIVDRRAMLVSALIYLGYSLFEIVRDFAFFGEFSNSIALVVLGVFVLGLGLAWQQIRRFFVENLVWASLRNKLPPVGV